ncbi:Hypothetical protein A7982_11755 [Minicystis rosea]|nr:Hypothetical protein A7982_11755 [Minicystis rosea]
MSDIAVDLAPVPLTLAVLSAFLLAGIVVRTVAGAVARIISRGDASEGG